MTSICPRLEWSNQRFSSACTVFSLQRLQFIAKTALLELSTFFVGNTEPSSARKDNKCQYLSERRVRHGDVVVGAIGLHGGSEHHEEVSQRQKAHHVHDDVQQVSFAPISRPAN